MNDFTQLEWPGAFAIAAIAASAAFAIWAFFKNL